MTRKMVSAFDAAKAATSAIEPTSNSAMRAEREPMGCVGTGLTTALANCSPPAGVGALVAVVTRLIVRAELRRLASSAYLRRSASRANAFQWRASSGCMHRSLC